jgi:hypothetical protein
MFRFALLHQRVGSGHGHGHQVNVDCEFWLLGGVGACPYLGCGAVAPRRKFCCSYRHFTTILHVNRADRPLVGTPQRDTTHIPTVTVKVLRYIIYIRYSESSDPPLLNKVSHVASHTFRVSQSRSRAQPPALLWVHLGGATCCGGSWRACQYSDCTCSFTMSSPFSLQSVSFLSVL